MIDRIKSLLGRNDNPQCQHVTKDIRPSEDASIWHLIERTRSEPRWSETDALYVKMQDVTEKYICVGCGEDVIRRTGERIQGEDALKRKSELSDEERARFRKLHSGTYFNNRAFRTSLKDNN